MSLIRFFIFSLGFVLAIQAKTEELNPYLKIGSKIKLDQSDLEPMTLVSAGNRDQVTIPEFPSYTKIYARATFSGSLLDSLTSQPTDYAIRLGEKRLKNIISELKKNGIINEAIRVGKIFKIDPVHILGPIIGENTFNGSIDRTIQDSFAQMFTDSDFTNMTERMNQYANHPEVKRCMESDIRNYWKWRCVLFYSNNSANNANGDLINQYYSITNRGVGTFGIGQVQPFLLWSYSDIVKRKT